MNILTRDEIDSYSLIINYNDKKYNSFLKKEKKEIYLTICYNNKKEWIEMQKKY